MAATTAYNHGPKQVPRYIYSYVTPPQLYSDHYPEHQNRQDGIISIAFSRSTIRGVYTNNDSVRGVVHVRSNIKIKSVSIKFIGRSSCRTFEGASQHVSSIDLFRHELALQRISMPTENCPPNRIEYPFEFRFPEAVQLPPSTPCPPDPRFETSPGHALPPSLWWDESTIRNEYVLEAQFISEERHCTMTPKVIHQLRFFPSIPELSLPLPPPLHPTSPIRLERKPRPSQARSKTPSPLRRLSLRLTGSPEPLPDVPTTAPFLVLSVPPYYRIGTRTPLKISLQTTSSPGAEPTIFLRGLRALALATLSYRIPDLTHNIFRQGTSKFDLFNRRYALPGLPLSTTGPTEVEPFELVKSVPPSFRTYNVALWYDVRYDVLLEWGGREYEVEVLVQGVGVEPRTREGGWLGPPGVEEGTEEEGVEAEAPRAMQRTYSDLGTADIEPPAYEP